MVKNAVNASDVLKRYDIQVFAQGSYRNRTNVRQDSDVDICVCLRKTIGLDFGFADGLTREDVGLGPVEYLYVDFKNDLEVALRSYFGSENVTRGNKAFDIKENSYHVEIDVVPALEHRRYRRTPGLPGYAHTTGTEIRPDNGRPIINWPNQNYENGVQKNDKTDKRFKGVVRILKSLCNEMAENGVPESQEVPGYLIECVVWNVPDPAFGHVTLYDDVKESLRSLYFNTQADNGPCHEWGEVNELKYLFRGGQKWTRDQAHQFIRAAWRYVRFAD